MLTFHSNGAVDFSPGAVCEMDGRKMECHYLFYAAGKSLFLLPFLTQPGHFWIHGTMMRLELPNRPQASGRFQIEERC